jgi:hypothetical protein
MNINKRWLTIAAVAFGLIAFVSIVMGLISRQSNQDEAEKSVAATAAPAPVAEVPPTAPVAAQPAATDDSAPSGPPVFGTQQNDTQGFDEYDWDASIADVAGKRAKPAPVFTQDSGGYNGPLDLPTIIWMGIGLPPNHHVAQASTFDPVTFTGAQFSTVRRGRTQYIFADGRFVMAVIAEDPRMYDTLRQKLSAENEEIASMRAEQTFDMAEAGSGLPPDTISTECFRRANTNTRIYLIEKWSSTLLGSVTFHRVFVVYIPNADYQWLLNAATHSAQASTAAPPAKS